MAGAFRVKPHIGQGAISAIEDAAVLGVLLSNIPDTGDVADHISQRLKLNDRLRIPKVAAYKYYSDVPFFRNAVEEQREKCERFMKPEDLPGELIGAHGKFWVIADASQQPRMICGHGMWHSMWLLMQNGISENLCKRMAYIDSLWFDIAVL